MHQIKFLLIILLVPVATIAQDTPSKIESDSVLQTVTVTGFSKGEKINKQSAPIAYIAPQELENFAPQNPVMAWNSLPGVNLEQRAVASYRVSIRGSSIRSPFGVRDVKVYWNGLPFTEANGSTALNLLSNSQMQSLEVVKGPAGSMYGAGLGGVMQIRNFPDALESPLSLQLTRGSFNQLGASLKGQVEKGKFTGLYSIDHQQNDGYREHNALNRQNYQLSTAYQFNEDHQINLHLLYSDLDYEIPGGLTLERFQEDPRQARPGSIPQNASIDQQPCFMD